MNPFLKAMRPMNSRYRQVMAEAEALLKPKPTTGGFDPSEPRATHGKTPAPTEGEAAYISERVKAIIAARQPVEPVVASDPVEVSAHVSEQPDEATGRGGLSA